MLFRPSKAYQWSNCALSPHLQLPDDAPRDGSDDAAREGTCAAWVAECVIMGQYAACRDMIGVTHENGWMVTDEMADDIQNYVDLIKRRGGNTRAEHYVALSMHPHIAGTMDATSDTTRNDGLLYVDDLKYGRRIVEIYENPQLVIYGAARARAFEPGTIQRVQLGIYQPRSFHTDGIYRRWVLTVEELEQRAVELIEKARACLAPNPIATPGPWCSHCDGASRCEALAHTAYALIERMQRTTFRERTGIELSYDLDFCDTAEQILTAFSDALRAEAKERLRGEFVPGWHMQPSKGKRRFKYPASVIQMSTGVDPWKPREVCTPAELERRGASKEAVEALSERPDRAPKLSRLSENTIAGYFRDKGEAE